MKTNQLLMAALVLVLSCKSFANGGRSDGGGNAVVCRDRDQHIISVELLDLYEMRLEHSERRFLEFDSNLSYLDIAIAMAKKIDQGGAGEDPTWFRPESPDSTGKVIKKSVGFKYSAGGPGPSAVQSRVPPIDHAKIILPGETGLVKIDDSITFFVPPPNCSIIQTAAYHDENDALYVVGDVWSKMDRINQAALLVHEALYYELRGNLEVTSDRTRRAVGLAFSGYTFENIKNGVPRGAIICWSDEAIPQTRFAVYPDQKNDAILQFFELYGKELLSKATVGLLRGQSPLATHTIHEGNERTTTLFKLNSPIDGNPKTVFEVQRSPRGNISMSMQRSSRLNIDPALSVAVNCSN